MSWTPRRVLGGLLEAVPHHVLEHWWPVDDAYHRREGTDPRVERIAGAVLVQNTHWRQVERALDALKAAHALDLDTLATLDLDRLRALVRSAGFVARKPATLQAVARMALVEGGLDRLAEQAEDDPDPVRRVLLEVHGVGPETADAILAYALASRAFVVDAYTRRLMARLGITLDGDTERQRDPLRAEYVHVANWWTRGPEALPREAEVYRIAHAAIIEHAKRLCRRRLPDCGHCPLRADCAFARAVPASQAV